MLCRWKGHRCVAMTGQSDTMLRFGGNVDRLPIRSPIARLATLTTIVILKVDFEIVVCASEVGDGTSVAQRYPWPCPTPYPPNGCTIQFENDAKYYY